MTPPRHHLNQGAILILSSAAMCLIALPALNWWGFVVGLAAQPFWFVTTWRARQWGMFANAVIYTGALVAGAVNYY